MKPLKMINLVTLLIFNTPLKIDSSADSLLLMNDLVRWRRDRFRRCDAIVKVLTPRFVEATFVAEVLNLRWTLRR